MARILIAPDSFKGSLTASQFCQISEHVIQQIMPDAEVIQLPLSDGGEGFVDAFVSAGLATQESLWVSGPLGKKVKAAFAWQESSKTAMIEMAQASGLPKVRPDEGNPMQTHTYGTGQVIQAALDKGAQKVVLGLGGSATNDGGIGALQALGVEILDAKGISVGLGGQALKTIAKIGEIPQILTQVEWVLACDVTNPLLGEEGATAIFGPQKGLQEHQFDFLENGLDNWAQVMQDKLGKDVRGIPGAGAAGGMAAGFIGVLNAHIEPGFEVLREQLEIDAAMEPKDGKPLDLVITGEGRIDQQTAFGKLPVRIAELAKEHRVPCIGICGSLGATLDELPAFTALFSIVNTPMDEMDAMNNAPPLLASCLQNILALRGLK
ncbi:glycerate kinase [Thiomicrorhabdus sp. 6S2-11]|uniref:Glycerate kinase n=1 Tax=Thiomicrorhabdus marina TaxID=2818442 RepID=A0ABS3Q274_9GAMM|nr:glycerate kinase [Thiomicrorhabdus marina]MBO1926435.1 glycerate kinase [Thiomicrorhabdus marina]